MFDALLPLREDLRVHSRLRPPSLVGHGFVGAIQILVLLLLGAAAAATTELVDLKSLVEAVVATLTGQSEFKMRLPGHAILSSIFPMALGLAVIPRRGAGTVMGVGALLMNVILPRLEITPGLGSIVSVATIGPALDLALRNTRHGWRVYAGFAVAGLAANLIAFAVQATAKYYGVSGISGKPLAAWLPTAAVTYPVFGLLAGLVSAAVWFRFRDRRTPESQP